MSSDADVTFMARAIELAQRGIGFVEPNPPVGAVIVVDNEIVGEGWHQKYGGPHAEVHALNAADLDPQIAKNATLYVTLEPCNHRGQTPPCSQAILNSGIRRVVIGSIDPAAHGEGSGASMLVAAGLDVQTHLLKEKNDALIAPFRKLMVDGFPWVHAKWAMSLDGKTSGSSGESKWITSDASRAIVHQIRGRMDAIIVGSGTVRQDDPQLTVRPPGHRIPTRVVFDSTANLPLDSQLVQTAKDTPVLLFCGASVSQQKQEELESRGVRVIALPDASPKEQVQTALRRLGEQKMTNVLVEGGGTLLGSFWDAGQVDEVHAFIAPLVIGGQDSSNPLRGIGAISPDLAARLERVEVSEHTGDLYVHGFFPAKFTGDIKRLID